MSEKIKAELMTITPEIASKMLEKNTKNFRRLDWSRVERYALDIKAGNWDMNGESIKFNGDVLIDGQHRLAAIVKAGTGIRSFVIRGIESHKNIDIGRPRKASDWLRHIGIKNACDAAAIARFCVIHDMGLWNRSSCGVSYFTSQKIIEFAEKNNEKIQDCIAIARPCKKIVYSSMLSTVMFFGSGDNLPSEVDTCLWFCEGLATGANLSNDEPVLLLRNRIADKPVTKKIGEYPTRMLLTIAWNKTAKGLSAAQLKLYLSGPGRQEPPNKIEVANTEDDE